MPTKSHKTGFRGPSPDVGKATQFKPGHAPLPGAGAPKLKPWTAAIREIAGLRVSKRKKRTMLQAVVEKLYRMARAGNLAAIKEIIDRSEGKAIQALEISGPDGGFVPVRLDDAAQQLRPSRKTRAARDGLID